MIITCIEHLPRYENLLAKKKKQLRSCNKFLRKAEDMGKQTFIKEVNQEKKYLTKEIQVYQRAIDRFNKKMKKKEP